MSTEPTGTTSYGACERTEAPHRPEYDSTLARLAEIADSFGATPVAADARSLAERVAEGRFYVACVGQFKRGKSALLDALIGEPLLPTGVVPVTTVPTVVRYGNEAGARVKTSHQPWQPISLDQVAQYVSEDHNPANAKQVSGVEVFVPAPLLAGGMCLVDTPGLGSVFAGNTAATQEFIPHIDAAIVVIGADPPISGEELAIAETVAAQVRDLLFVLNKADRVTEQERQTAAAFARKLLESRLRHPVGTIYQVSAAEHLAARGPDRDWPQFVADLQTLAEHSGQTLALAARERGLRRITDHLLRVVHEERDALVRPVEESERRITVLRSTIADAERSMIDLAYLLIAEQHRLSRLLADRRSEFLKASGDKAHQELSEGLQEVTSRRGPVLRRLMMRAAQEVAQRRLLPWLSSEETFAEQAFRQVAQRFVDLGNHFLERLAQAGITELARMPQPLEAETGFRTRSHFHFHEFIELAQPASPIRFCADLALGILGGRRSIERDAHEFLDRLLYANTMRVQSDVDTRVNDGKSKLQTDIRILLHEVSGAAERALSHARSARDAGNAAIQGALARIASVEAELLSIRPPSS